MLPSALACLCLALFVAAPAQTPSHAKTRAKPAIHSSASAKARAKAKSHAGTRRAPVRKKSEGISDARALELQQALVKAGYLDHASGHWDAASKAAMTRFQKDQHWQTHYVPDARAIIALGLGPVNDQPPVQAAAAGDWAPGELGER